MCSSLPQRESCNRVSQQYQTAALFNPQALMCSRHSGTKQMIDITKIIIALIWKHNNVFLLKIIPVVSHEEDREGQRHVYGCSSHHYLRNGAVHHETTHPVHLPFFLLNKHQFRTSVNLPLCVESLCFYLTSSYKINYTSPILPRDKGGKNSLRYSDIFTCCVLIMYLVSNPCEALKTNFEKTQNPTSSSGDELLCSFHRNETIFFGSLVFQSHLFPLQLLLPLGFFSRI